ncbi:DUF1643 domain-containing protein [Roseobacter sp. HKCCA0434]|uniref:DUF1643 domain-containing protein n=1 Tax=Roseobacter sp. HKCCA0434 TaxID=3079297 RepID=UPI002905EED2|nr:DUF1643 domain-containing protein [Roseobacter sp. HKCCA0434]
MSASGGSICRQSECTIRRHVDGETVSEAEFSPCGTYRYALTRRWSDGPRLAWIMLNPSKADERRNDPTVVRCERRARAGGFGGFRVVNLFALMATDPRELKAHAEPEGPGNAAALRAACDWADIVVCGWGVHGAHRGQGKRVRTLLSKWGARPRVLGLTRDGHPRHPLYVGYAQGFVDWPEGVA